MNEFEMSAYIVAAREMLFMLMDEHGILCEDSHRMTGEELLALSDDEIVHLFNLCYGKE